MILSNRVNKLKWLLPEIYLPFSQSNRLIRLLHDGEKEKKNLEESNSQYNLINLYS